MKDTSSVIWIRIRVTMVPKNDQKTMSAADV